jgi:hypothetical protein
MLLSEEYPNLKLWFSRSAASVSLKLQQRFASVKFLFLGDRLFCGTIFCPQSRTGRYRRYQPTSLAAGNRILILYYKFDDPASISNIVFNRKHRRYKLTGTYLYNFSTFVDDEREILLCPSTKCPGTPFESSGSPIACLTAAVLSSFAYLGCTNIALAAIYSQLSSLRSVKMR